jgi:predicted RNA-binding Zn-ribbon protein involved in translation (DUF1610 family)
MAWEEQVWGRYALQKLAYSLTRAAFPALAAQVVIRCIARVADAYKLNRQHPCHFTPRSALAYDDRILRWYTGQSTVSIWASGGRLRLPFVCGERQRALLQTQQGESDLVYRDGVFYLYATCDGMRERTTVSRRQRARHANWAFFQLRQFITYKAQRAGVTVIPVDPRHTSCTCPACGNVARSNRRTQALFSCIACGYSAPADYNAAQNIRARATVNRPMVSIPNQGEGQAPPLAVG